MLILIIENTNCWVLAYFLIEGGLDKYEEKRFINLVSNTNNHHFVNNIFIDIKDKKIVLNHTIKY